MSTEPSAEAAADLLIDRLLRLSSRRSSLPDVVVPGESDVWIIPFWSLGAGLDVIADQIQGAVFDLAPPASVRVDSSGGYGLFTLGKSVTPDLAVAYAGLFRDQVKERLRRFLGVMDGLPSLVGEDVAEYLNSRGDRRDAVIRQIVEMAIDFPAQVIQAVLDSKYSPQLEVENNSRERIESESPNAGSIEFEIDRLADFQDSIAGTDTAALLDEIRARASELERAKERLDRAVIAGRAAQITWTAIGRAVGITQQSASARWNPVVKRNRAEYQRRRNAGAPSEPDVEGGAAEDSAG